MTAAPSLRKPGETLPNDSEIPQLGKVQFPPGMDGSDKPAQPANAPANGSGSGTGTTGSGTTGSGTTGTGLREAGPLLREAARPLRLHRNMRTLPFSLPGARPDAEKDGAGFM